MIYRHKQLNIRLSDEELTTISHYAIDLSMGKAQFVRFLLRQYYNRLRMMPDKGRNTF
jgi:hypothetical protein